MLCEKQACVCSVLEHQEKMHCFLHLARCSEAATMPMQQLPVKIESITRASSLSSGCDLGVAGY